LGIIKLDTAGAIAPTDLRKNKKFCFTIETPVRTYFICAPNESEKESWIKELTAERDRVQGKNKPAAPAASAGTSSGSSAPAGTAVSFPSFFLIFSTRLICLLVDQQRRSLYDHFSSQEEG